MQRWGGPKQSNVGERLLDSPLLGLYNNYRARRSRLLVRSLHAVLQNRSKLLNPERAEFTKLDAAWEFGPHQARGIPSMRNLPKCNQKSRHSR